MVVCRFFQEGRCKFGENCRNEHYLPQDRNRRNYNNQPQYDDHSYQQPQKYFNQAPPQRQQYFPQPQQSAPQPLFQNRSTFPQQQQRLFTQNQNFGSQPSQYNVPIKNQYGALQGQQAVRGEPDGQESIIRSHLNTIREDANSWSNSGQWPFSCYAPLLRRLLNLPGGQKVNDSGSLPGLIDYSPEELRWEMYKSNALGTVNQMLNQLQLLAADYSMKRNALQNMDELTANFVVRFESGGMANPMGTAFASSPITLLSSEGVQLPNKAPSGFSFAIPESQSTPAPTQQPTSSFTFSVPSAAAAPTVNPPQSFSFKLPSAQAPAAPALFQNTSASNPVAPTFGFGVASAVPTQVQQSGSFGSPAYGGNLSQTSSSLYSSGSTLKAEEMEQFKAAKFCMGKIPMVPPPQECV